MGDDLYTTETPIAQPDKAPAEAGGQTEPPVSIAPDLEFIRAVRGRDWDRLGQVIEDRFGGLVWRVCVNLLPGRDSDAEEAYVSAFVSAVQQIRRSPGSVSPPLAGWLVRLTRDESMGQFSPDSFPVLDPAVLGAMDGDSTAAEREREASERIVIALGRKDYVEFRLVHALREAEAWSWSQVASVLQTDADQARRRYAALVERIAAVLGPEQP